MNKKRYSIEQIKVALALFDKLKNVTKTVRQLGYPSKNQLYEWINHRESSNGAFPEISSDGIRKKKVVCPNCKSHKVVVHEYRKRTVRDDKFFGYVAICQTTS